MSEVREHIIIIQVEDRFGALQRIAGVFSKRAFNMNTITVGKTNVPGLSRMVITTVGDQRITEQIIKQLSKLVETIKVYEVGHNDAVVREIALIKVHIKDYAARSEVMNFAEIFRAKIVDVAKDSLMIEITGTSEKVDALIDLLRPFGVKEIARTGITALARD